MDQQGRAGTQRDYVSGADTAGLHRAGVQNQLDDSVYAYAGAERAFVPFVGQQAAGLRAAPQAGAAIHGDFEEKFIRAEVIHWDALLAAGSWSAARDQGTLRIEGKDYIIDDGDVIVFRV